MMSRIRSVALFANQQDERVSDCYATLTEYLRRRGILIVDLTRGDDRDVDMAIALGGDGTLLRAARTVIERQIPLLGINRGRLGFLTDISPESMLQDLERILAGDCVEDRRTLFVNAHRGDGLVVATTTGSTAYALSWDGPIAMPNVDVLVVTPICPYTLSDRPLVIGADCTVEVKVLPGAACPPQTQEEQPL